MKKTLSLVMTSALAAALMLPLLAKTAPAQAATAAQTSTAKTKAVKAPAPPAPTAQEIADAQAKGLVWVNTNSKVYHASGPLYGKTKHGKFMTKDEAEKAGFKAAKEHASKHAAKKAAPAAVAKK